jgi:hypothetical protein
VHEHCGNLHKQTGEKPKGPVEKAPLSTTRRKRSPEKREQGPGIVPPVARPSEPEAEQGHAYGHKAADGFCDWRRGTKGERFDGMDGRKEDTFDLYEGIVDVDTHRGDGRVG